jgi:hypothetical protein
MRRIENRDHREDYGAPHYKLEPNVIPADITDFVRRDEEGLHQSRFHRT